MFLSDEATKIPLRPAASQIGATDWEVLSHFWYPVAIAAEIADHPAKASLLDVDLVLFRDEKDQVAIALDRCPHRFIRLSSGQVRDGQIECPFHGLRFDGTGQCRHIPSLGRSAKLPQRYAVRTFPARERYGLIWTCLGDPAAHDIPFLPEFADMPAADITFAPVSDWAISAPRQIENFFDLSHLPFVHASTLGGNQDSPLKPGRIEQAADAVTLHAEYSESDGAGGHHLAYYTYRIVLPFVIDFQVRYADETRKPLISCDIASPVSAHVSRVFQLHKVEGGPTAGAALVNMLEAVNAEDRAILAELAFADLPLGQAHEIHLPVDNIAHSYRAGLRALGLGKAG